MKFQTDLEIIKILKPKRISYDDMNLEKLIIDSNI